MGGTSQKLRYFTEHPATRLIVGLILFSSGSFEAYQNLSDLSNFQLAAHHGVMIFGIFNMLASIPDMLEGLSSSAEAMERARRRRDADDSL